MDALRFQHTRESSCRERGATSRPKSATARSAPALVASIGAFVAPALDHRLDGVSDLADRLTPGDLETLARAIIANDKERRWPSEWAIKAILSGRDDTVAREFTRWLFQTALDEEHHHDGWVRAFTAMLDPLRDREVVDELLDLVGTERERFKHLVEPVEIASVPLFMRRHSRSAASNSGEHSTNLMWSERVDELIRQPDGWLTIVTESITRNHMTSDFADSDLFAALSPEQRDALASIADEFADSYDESAMAANDPDSVSGFELAFAACTHTASRSRSASSDRWTTAQRTTDAVPVPRIPANETVRRIAEDVARLRSRPGSWRLHQSDSPRYLRATGGPDLSGCRATPVDLHAPSRRTHWHCCSPAWGLTRIAY